MGQHTTTQDFDLSILANYVAMMGFIRTSLLADGCTIVADSGDTDPTGLGAVPAQNDYSNYEMWMMPSAAGLTDIFFKLGYGRNTANGPSLKVDVGTGSDGAGTVTGDVVNANFPGGATAAGAGSPAYVSADVGWVMICFNPAGEHGYVVIDRAVDGTGAPADGYYTRYIYQNGNGPQQESKNIGGGTQPPSQGSMVGAFPNVWLIGTDILIALMHPVVRGGLAQPSPNVARWSSGFTNGTQSTIPVYGSNKTYIATAASAGSGHLNLLRYE